jgi:transcription elongation GreA/GreB family factor
MSVRSSDPASSPISESGRRLLNERVQQLEARLEVLRAALDDAERGREIVEEHLRVADERDRIVDVLTKSRLVIDGPDDPLLVEVGDTVGIQLADGTEERYTLVNGLEAEVDDECISLDSPLARALLGRRVGEIVEVRAPSGAYRCTVTAASRR